MSFHTYSMFKVFFTWTPFHTVMILRLIKLMCLIGHSGQWPEVLKESRKSNRQRLKPKWMTSGEFQVNQIQTNQPDWKNRLDCLSSLANSDILDGIDKRELSKATINIITLKWTLVSVVIQQHTVTFFLIYTFINFNLIIIFWPYLLKKVEDNIFCSRGRKWQYDFSPIKMLLEYFY